MKEVVISESSGSRVIRLGGPRYDWRVEKLVKLLLRAMEGPVETAGADCVRAAEYAGELGWRKDEKGEWVRE